VKIFTIEVNGKIFLSFHVSILEEKLHDQYLNVNEFYLAL